MKLYSYLLSTSSLASVSARLQAALLPTQRNLRFLPFAAAAMFASALAPHTSLAQTAHTPVVLNNFQEQTDWIQPGNVGDDKGGNPGMPNGNFTVSYGNPALFSADPAFAYNNGYFYRDIKGSWNNMTYFAYRMQIMFPTSEDLASSQAIEFELQQNVGGKIYNMAYQFDFKGSRLVRTFDYTTSRWIATAIPVTALKLTPGVWNSIEATFERDPDASTMTHIAIVINGVTYPVNVTRPATPRVEKDYVHAAFQLDSSSPARPYAVLVKDMGVSMMPTGD